jgi:hypothetical protein
VISLAHLAVFWTAGLLTGTLLGLVLGGETPTAVPQRNRPAKHPADRRAA